MFDPVTLCLQQCNPNKVFTDWIEFSILPSLCYYWTVLLPTATGWPHVTDWTRLSLGITNLINTIEKTAA